MRGRLEGESDSDHPCLHFESGISILTHVYAAECTKGEREGGREEGQKKSKEVFLSFLA